MRGNAALAYPPVKYSVTRLGAGQTYTGATYPGGLDLTTPSLALQPGALRDVLNFECSQSGGYARIQGYERYDGRTSPSSATYQVIQFTAFTTVPVVGQIATQAVTGASGTIIVVSNLAGAYYIVVTQITGSFNYTDAVSVNTGSLTVTAANPQTITAANPLTISDGFVGNATTPMVALSALLNAQYLAAAADVYRSAIGAVPGSGAVLGVVGMIFGTTDNVYAFRANVAGTAVNLYRSSTAGWVQVPFFNTVSFTTGSVAPADGDTITQGVVTATIKRVMWQSGTYGASTAAGTLVVTTPTGGNFTGGPATTSSGGVVSLTGPQTSITLAPGGHFEFVKCNFSGQLVTRRIYGCDGVNKCFEFDGTTLAPITTGLSPDRPSHIAFHKNFLFISQASSILYCGAGTPFMWGSINGGGEIATGDTVTGMVSLPGAATTAALAVYLRNNTSILYGTDPTTDFNFVSFNQGMGALPYSVQSLFDTFCFDDLGVINLRTSLNYGNFVPSSLTKNILPFILQERNKLIASSVNRDKSQYRVFFSDGYGLWLTMVNSDYLGASVVLFPNPVFCNDNGETTTGEEVTYFGSSDGLGYVYQMDVGTSFDGASIDAHITMAWDPIKSPRVLKRFRAASIEIQGSAYAAIQFGYSLGYGTTNIGQPGYVSYTTNFAAAPSWDSFVWDNFVWDGQSLVPTDIDMTGTAENIQYTISSTTNYIASFNVNSVITHMTPRRGIRP